MGNEKRLRTVRTGRNYSLMSVLLILKEKSEAEFIFHFCKSRSIRGVITLNAAIHFVLKALLSYIGSD
jgi:hypothetical protein